MKISLLTLLICFCFHSKAQILFEKGYFINNEGEKTTCLIKNAEWKNNPEELQYQLIGSEEVQTAGISELAEFMIGESVKYIRAQVAIDQSSHDINEYSTEKAPDFKEMQVFLKVLVEGKGSLYYFNSPLGKRFFFSIDNQKIEQLVYKPYRIDQSNMSYNRYFRQQLFQQCRSENISEQSLLKLDYDQQELVRFFIKYNKEMQASYTDYATIQKEKTDWFNLNLRAGLRQNALAIANPLLPEKTIDFGSKLGIRLGVEMEFVLPFNKNKWAMIVEPSLNSFKAETEIASKPVRANYQSIEVPLGIRHRFFINENSTIFANISVIPEIATSSSKITFENNRTAMLEIKPDMNLGFGLGYEYKNKYGFEIRYHKAKPILTKAHLWVSEYKTISATFSYRIL